MGKGKGCDADRKQARNGLQPLVALPKLAASASKRSTPHQPAAAGGNMRLVLHADAHAQQQVQSKIQITMFSELRVVSVLSAAAAQRSPRFFRGEGGGKGADVGGFFPSHLGAQCRPP